MNSRPGFQLRPIFAGLALATALALTGSARADSARPALPCWTQVINGVASVSEATDPALILEALFRQGFSLNDERLTRAEADLNVFLKSHGNSSPNANQLRELTLQKYHSIDQALKSRGITSTPFDGYSLKDALQVLLEDGRIRPLRSEILRNPTQVAGIFRERRRWNLTAQQLLARLRQDFGDDSLNKALAEYGLAKLRPEQVKQTLRTALRKLPAVASPADLATPYYAPLIRDAVRLETNKKLSQADVIEALTRQSGLSFDEALPRILGIERLPPARLDPADVAERIFAAGKLPVTDQLDAAWRRGIGPYVTREFGITPQDLAEALERRYGGIETALKARGIAVRAWDGYRMEDALAALRESGVPITGLAQLEWQSQRFARIFRERRKWSLTGTELARKLREESPDHPWVWRERNPPPLVREAPIRVRKTSPVFFDYAGIIRAVARKLPGIAPERLNADIYSPIVRQVARDEFGLVINREDLVRETTLRTKQEFAAAVRGILAGNAGPAAPKPGQADLRRYLRALWDTQSVPMSENGLRSNRRLVRSELQRELQVDLDGDQLLQLAKDEHGSLDDALKAQGLLMKPLEEIDPLDALKRIAESKRFPLSHTDFNRRSTQLLDFFWHEHGWNLRGRTLADRLIDDYGSFDVALEAAGLRKSPAQVTDPRSADLLRRKYENPAWERWDGVDPMEALKLVAASGKVRLAAKDFEIQTAIISRLLWEKRGWHISGQNLVARLRELGIPFTKALENCGLTPAEPLPWGSRSWSGYSPRP